MKAKQLGQLKEYQIGITAETEEEKELLTGLLSEYMGGHPLYPVGFAEDANGKVQSVSISVQDKGVD